MNIITVILIYLCSCLLYRNRQVNFLFVLQTLQTTIINKHRYKISEKIKIHSIRTKWFLFWPLIDMYELYEDWKANRNRNNKT
jgi:hypothetical protein